ncbi:hypothetical protein Xen7305DRAFT_00041240 [Xenococcus sp. PCC 7305]|uniref:hypothetical protein n=1 Tax=Xenococcus sp. PCC 7305 TaxID=102125 RepID=UPI0002AC138D|nr:hypothetical protein [Xenococcus sp. PCC 7305]ELS04391.1 hypothetical protein Xen7305DRAFT_00041240 [Xenococcus sp. PCC 7305]
MIPNLFQATQEYWRKLDELEAAYQKGMIPLEEVDAKVAELMAELGQERRATFAYLWHGWQNLLTTQRETIISLAILIVVTYAWLLNRPVI